MAKAEKPDGFDSARTTAEDFVQDKVKTGHLLDEAARKAERNYAALKDFWADLQALIRLAKAWRKGDYTAIPWQTLVFAIAGLVYFVNPFDFVPDFIPGAGFLDDATVIGFVIKSIKRDLERFLAWEGGDAR